MQRVPFNKQKDKYAKKHPKPKKDKTGSKAPQLNEVLFMSDKLCHLRYDCKERFTNCPFKHCINYDLPNVHVASNVYCPWNLRCNKAEGECKLVHPTEKEVQNEIKALKRSKEENKGHEGGSKKKSKAMIEEEVDEQYEEEKRAVYNKLMKSDQDDDDDVSNEKCC